MREVEQKKIEAEALVEEAEGIKRSNIREAEGQREAEALAGKGLGEKSAAIGQGEAKAILEKGLAEAEAKEKLAIALSKFAEEGLLALLGEKYIQKDKDVVVTIAKAYEDAEMKVIQTDDQKPENLMDFISSADSGARFGGMLEGLRKTLGIDVKDLVGGAKEKGSKTSDEVDKQS